VSLKKIVFAAAAAATLLSAAPAFAHPPGWAPAYGWRAPYRHPYYRPAYVYAPPPVYYVQPAPVYYAPPAPVFYGQIPISPGVQIGFRVRL